MIEKILRTKIVHQISFCRSSGSSPIKMCPNLYNNLKAVWYILKKQQKKKNNKKKKPRNLNPKVWCTADGNIPQLESCVLPKPSLIYVSLNEAQALAKFYMNNFFTL